MKKNSEQSQNIQIIDSQQNEIENTFKNILSGIQPFIAKLTEIQNALSPILQNAAIACKNWIEENPDFFTNLKIINEQITAWQNQKHTVLKMIHKGWYPNWFTFEFKIDASMDDLMKKHIESDWDRLVEKIIGLCPTRKHILESAIRLHKEQHYIASIPLFLTQADGICEEEFTSFFHKNKKNGKRMSTGDDICEHIDNGFIEHDLALDILLEPFLQTTQLSEHSKKSSPKAKSKGPNRNGILHGSAEHLDYGTELNSLKTFSFLCFIVYATKEVFVKINGGNNE